jgi:hypothetical protein
VRTPISAAGKKGKCPHCQAVVQIPGGSAPAPFPAPAAPALGALTPLSAPQPKPAAAAKPAASGPWKSPPAKPKPAAAPPAEEVEELPTLTPIDSTPGLTPLTPMGGAMGGAAGGLTSLGSSSVPNPFGASAGGLTPLGPASFGGAPGGGDLLSGLTPLAGPGLGPASIPNPYGPAPAANPLGANPYASPAGGGAFASPGYSQAGVSDAGRKGLPWERSADMDSFQDTAMQILGEPANAFMQMRRTGGIMNSLAFWIIAYIIGQTVNTVYSAILQAIILAGNNAPGEAYAALAIGAGLSLVFGIILSLILAPIFALIGAAIWHVVLLVFGCARGGFEATFRALCFVGGAAVLLNIIPIVGFLIAVFYAIALLIHAFTHAHEAPGGRVTGAVLTGYGLICCCVGPLIGFALISFISQAGARGF